MVERFALPAPPGGALFVDGDGGFPRNFLPCQREAARAQSTRQPQPRVRLGLGGSVGTGHGLVLVHVLQVR